MAIDYKKCAEEIIEKAGGADNINTVSHCMTRLRFTVKKLDKADMNAIKDIKGVMGCIYAGEQLQVIMGQNLLPVFDEVLKQNNFKVGDIIDENLDQPKEKLTFKTAGNAVLGYVSASVTPLVPGLIAGGMLKVFLLLIGMAIPAFANSQTNVMLGWIANAPFYFMPIFVAYGAIKKLGGTPIYAMLAAAALLTPDWTTMIGEGASVSLVGLPVRLVTYSNSLLPALLLALVAYYSEKILNKIVPGIFKSIFVGMGTIFITGVLSFTILGPIGNFAGSYLVYLFIWLSEHVGPIAVGLLAGLLPWIIMTGMHTVFGAFMTESISGAGYDGLFRPALILHNMAEGGACLGVGLKTKNKEFKSECLSIAFGCVVAGVSEPAIYGINLKLKKPMYAVMAGGACGGIVAGLFGAKAFMMGYSTILALPIFLETITGMAIACVVAILVAAIVAFMLGFDESSI